MALYRCGNGPKADGLGLIGELFAAPGALVRILARRGPVGRVAAILASLFTVAFFGVVIVFTGPFGPSPVWSPIFFAGGIAGLVAALLTLGSSVELLGKGAVDVDDPREKEAFMRIVEGSLRPVELCTECRIVVSEDDEVCPRCRQRGSRFTVRTKRDLELLRALLFPSREP